MSNAQTRQAVAAALNTVAGIHGHPGRPDVLSEGDGWPQWRGATLAAHALENRWDVLIVLPSVDDVTADSYADEHAEALIEVLRPIMYVESIAPAKLDSEAGGMYALLLTGRSE